MAVRFLPSPGERAAGPRPDRSDLAEVIELRSLMPRQGWAGEPALAGTAGTEHPESAIGDSADGAAGEGSAEVGVSDEGVIFASDVDGASAAEDAPEGRAPGDRAPKNSTSEDGVRLLARRARSSGELRAELLALGHDAIEIDGVIHDFERSLYLDDDGLARAVAEKLRETKRASRAQIRVKLRERRLPDTAIEAALAEFDEDEEFALLRDTAVQRAAKLSGLDRPTAERRLLGFLARRGWSGERAVRAARDALDGSPGRGAKPGSVRFR